jgi:8-oxo-dGTP pyrophosphatase MutT (NUDIX family)
MTETSGSKHWRRISKTVAFKTRIFDLNVERSECVRTGAIQDFYYIDCYNWVNVIAVTDDNQLIFIRQYRHGSNTLEMEIPGGGIDAKDPDPVAAGARELLEETGYAGSNGRIIGRVCPNPALQSNFCYTVMFTGCRKVSAPELEDTEEITTERHPLNTINELIASGQIQHGLVLNALHFFDIEQHKGV